MADTTPVHKRATEELPAIELLTYRLNQLEKNGVKAVDQNEKILALLQEVKIGMALGSKRFDDIEKTAGNHETRITNVESDKRGVAGIIAGIGAGLGAIGAWIFK